MYEYTRRSKKKKTCLKNVLEWIRSLMPMMNESFVSFSHDEIQVLIRCLRDKTIVHNTLFIFRREAMAVLVEGI
jgi:hypothetical protein